MRLSLPTCVVLMMPLLFLQVGQAQNVCKDYLSGPIQYSPSDPWTRGKVFNWQTGHAGLFSDCDSEECKRNSPYICWKSQHNSNAPLSRGLLRGLKIDIDQVKQRIQDGAGNCCSQGCTCSKCRAAKSHCGCAACLAGDSQCLYAGLVTVANANTDAAPPLPVLAGQVHKPMHAGVRIPSAPSPQRAELDEVQKASLTEVVKRKYGLITSSTPNYDATIASIEGRVVPEPKTDARTRVAEAIEALQKRR